MNTVIIMAGGLGKRMNSDVPKVLHKINNKPMLVHVIEQSIVLNPYKILIVVGKYKNIIEQTIGDYINYTNVNIQFITQLEPLGTGHAIQCCREELLKMHNKNVIILSGDVPLLKSDTINHILSDFNHVKIVTTILDHPYGYGRIIEQEGVFKKIVEEKDATEQEKIVQKVNCGIYIIKSQLLCKYLPLLENKNVQNEYYLTDIIELIKNGENVTVDLYTIQKDRQYEIIGVNTIEQLHILEKISNTIEINT
jgi:UDP-N-acetylglucosamine diphosphorylase/glucosamine-1-phosphate N-acetyltransferase